MNEPSDAAILASARRALADAAPAEPSPALLAAVRHEAARRARLVRFRRAFFLAAAAAAAVLLALVHPVSTGPRPSPGVEAQVASADHPADAAVRLLLFDAAEARAVLASASASEDGEDEESGTAAAEASSGADDADWTSLSFADALLAWQEAPLADLGDSFSATF